MMTLISRLAMLVGILLQFVSAVSANDRYLDFQDVADVHGTRDLNQTDDPPDTPAPPYDPSADAQEAAEEVNSAIGLIIGLSVTGSVVAAVAAVWMYRRHVRNQAKVVIDANSSSASASGGNLVDTGEGV
jgi:hypothetical protein